MTAQARGAVLGALSTTNAEFRLPLELAEALSISPVSYGGPYVKRCPTLQTYTTGLERMAVPDALTVQEAMEVFDLWSKDDAMPSGMSSFVRVVKDGVDMGVYSTDRRAVLVEIQRVVWKCEGFRVEGTFGVPIDVNSAVCWV